ncbi:MAG TPA: L,D-transpeptidase [bacterium]|nr:L,D-transpeptidase [bacterium]
MTNWPVFSSSEELPKPAAESLPSDLSDLAPESRPTPAELLSIQINLPAARLDLYSNGKKEISYPVAIGMPKYPTPDRDYSITHIVWNPWWIPPDSEWAAEAEKTPPGPGNPLGPVKLLMQDGILIHGTNSPSSIGRAASHACLRMKADDVRALAWRIQMAYSDKRDPELFEKYKKNRRSSFWITLFAEVPVSIQYRQVELEGDKVLIHPDRYWRGGLQEELAALLTQRPDVAINSKLLAKLRKLRRKGSVEASLTELADWGRDDADSKATATPLPPPLLKEAAKPLQ